MPCAACVTLVLPCDLEGAVAVLFTSQQLDGHSPSPHSLGFEETWVDAKPLCACIDCPPVPFYRPHSLMTGFTPWRLVAVNSSTKMVRTSSRAESRITKRTSVLAVIEHPQCHSTWYMARNPSGFDTMYRRPLNAVSTCGSLADIG